MFQGLKRKSLAEKVLYCFVSLIFLIVAASYLYILVWTVISSLKTHPEIVLKPFANPEKWQWKNYLELATVFQVGEHNFWDMVFNSMWFSVVGALLNQLTTITFAYICTKYVFPGSKLVNTIILIMISLPIYGSSGAAYKLYHDLGLLDNYAHVLLSCSGFSMWFLYYRAYFKNLSSTYLEAAFLDGASDLQAYVRVMFPQARPIFTACFITTWLGSWNSYESTLVYLPNLPTLPVGIYQFNAEMIYKARLDVLFAGCVLVSIPAIVIFVAFNKILTENVSLGGIKG